jgi:glycosyltransferase involved in cell wall biosynthesis
MTLRRLLREQQVDILNTHSSLDSWVGLAAWQTLGRKPLWVRTRHLSTPVRGSWPTRSLYQAPAALITTGQGIKELLAQRLRVPRSRIFSIPTGVSLTEFFPQEPDPARRAHLGIPARAYIFGTVAVLRSWKGHLYLLEALAQLLKDGSPAFLVVVGEGPYRVVIEEKIAALELQERVRLVGYQEAVDQWFALMDAVVLASYANEGVPQALLQALAMAKPVVGTAVGGLPEVVLPGETGLLVPPRDSQALAGAMRRLLEHPEYGRELGRRGREMVAAKFSLEQMAVAVEAVYDDLWEKGRGR